MFLPRGSGAARVSKTVESLSSSSSYPLSLSFLLLSLSLFIPFFLIMDKKLKISDDAMKKSSRRSQSFFFFFLSDGICSSFSLLNRCWRIMYTQRKLQVRAKVRASPPTECALFFACTINRFFIINSERNFSFSFRLLDDRILFSYLFGSAFVSLTSKLKASVNVYKHVQQKNTTTHFYESNNKMSERWLLLYS